MTRAAFRSDRARAARAALLAVAASGLVAPSLLAAPAAAQRPCFAVPGERAGRAQHLVGVDDVVQISPRCEYGLAAQGPWFGPGDVAGRDTDFLELWAQLLAQPSARASGDPRVIYARPTSRGAEDTQHTLMLRYCAHYLLEEQLGFRVVPVAADGGFRIERVSAPECDGGSLELRAVSGAGRARVWTRDAEQTLEASQRELELPQGDWSVYAARPGSPAGLRVGVFRSQRVVTPLQNHLNVVGLQGASREPPLLAARWEPGGPGMLLYPTAAARQGGLLWSELRTAADAGVLWVAGRQGSETPIVLGDVQLEAPESDGDAAGVRLPDRVVRAYMSATYGEAGDSMVPTNDDWREIVDGLALCLTPSYHDARPVEAGWPAPSAEACASLGGLAALAQADAAVPESAAGGEGARACLRHGMQVITASGPRQQLGEPECFALPEPGSLDEAPRRFAVSGDRITLEGRGLCAVVDGRPVPFSEGTNEVVLPAGLLEIRQGGGDDCTGRQAVARMRLPVLDPYTEWHPVGLHTGGADDEAPESPWAQLSHDEPTHFGVVDARHELEFRLSTSAPLAAAVGGRGGADVALTQDVPRLAGTTGRFGGAPAPAVVAYVSRDDACPADRPVSELAAEVPLDVDDLLVDATFHVHLLGVTGLDATATCLARASFRVRPSRALLSYTVDDSVGFEVGVLGDTQLAFFYASSGEAFSALGLVLPLAWARFTPVVRFVALELAANLTGALAFDPEEAALLGGSLSAALVLGVPEYLPRILSVGGMIHVQADTFESIQRDAVAETVAFSFYVGLNLATLIDLAGGR